MNGMAAWCRVVIAGSLLVAAGCASAPPAMTTAEVPPVRLRHAQTGARERCGLELIREVQRRNDLRWTERLFYWRMASRDAREAVRGEQEWRRLCVERYRTQGYEVVATPSPR